MPANWLRKGASSQEQIDSASTSRQGWIDAESAGQTVRGTSGSGKLGKEQAAVKVHRRRGESPVDSGSEDADY